MPDSRGNKRMGFEPYLLYDPEVRAAARLSPRAERQADLDIDSIGSMGSSVELWDRVPPINPNNPYL
jgi:hypothetical protein